MNSFQNLHQPTRRNLLIDDKSYLFFGGTAYLGLLDNPEYITLYKEGIDKYGLNNGTSRSNNIQLGIYQEAEYHLAERFDFESSALFSSGYLAAQATVRALGGGQEVLYAPGTHPALWLGDSPSVNIDFEEWMKDTILYVNESPKKRFVIVSNCIDNLRPSSYDFSGFDKVDANKEVLFILDDSHGLGVVFKNGVSSDLTFLQAKDNFDIVVVSSLAKGLGTDAGVVLGGSENIDKVKRHPIFLGASPASPAAMYALVKGTRIYEESFEKLHSNIDFFERKLPLQSGLSHIDDFPVFTSTDVDLYSYLSENNVLISSFPYPLVTSPLLNRIVISALHREEDLSFLAEIYLSKFK